MGGEEIKKHGMMTLLAVVVSDQNTSLSSLEDSFDQLDGSESQSLQDQPLHKAHRGKRSKVTRNRNSCQEAKRPRLALSSCPLSLLPFFLPSSDTSSKANDSAFRSLHMQPSDGSSSEELSVSGKTQVLSGWSRNITVCLYVRLDASKQTLQEMQVARN